MEAIVEVNVVSTTGCEHFEPSDTGCIDFAKLKGAVNAVAARFGQVQFRADILNSSTCEDALVVNIPKEIRAEIDKGTSWLNEKRDGSGILPQVMTKSKDGRARVKKNLTVEQKPVVLGDSRREFVRDINSLCLQQQLSAIAVQVEETFNCVLAIKDGQKNDRYGAVLGALNQISYSLDVQDDIALRMAIGSLQGSAGVVGESLRVRIASFEKIPNSTPRLIAKMLFGKKYTDRKRTEFDEIVDYFKLYEKAQEALVIASYLANGEVGVGSILAQRKSFLEGLTFSNLRTLRNLLPASFLKYSWIDGIGAYIEESEARYERLLEGSRETIEATVGAGRLTEVTDGDNACVFE